MENMRCPTCKGWVSFKGSLGVYVCHPCDQLFDIDGAYPPGLRTQREVTDENAGSTPVAPVCSECDGTGKIPAGTCYNCVGTGTPATYEQRANWGATEPGVVTYKNSAGEIVSGRV